jgi:hypothetical protein
MELITEKIQTPHDQDMDGLGMSRVHTFRTGKGYAHFFQKRPGPKKRGRDEVKELDKTLSSSGYEKVPSGSYSKVEYHKKGSRVVGGITPDGRLGSVFHYEDLHEGTKPLKSLRDAIPLKSQQPLKAKDVGAPKVPEYSPGSRDDEDEKKFVALHHILQYGERGYSLDDVPLAPAEGPRVEKVEPMERIRESEYIDEDVHGILDKHGMTQGEDEGVYHPDSHDLPSVSYKLPGRLHHDLTNSGFDHTDTTAERGGQRFHTYERGGERVHVGVRKYPSGDQVTHVEHEREED